MRKLFTGNRIFLQMIAISLFIAARASCQVGEPLITDTVHFRVNMSYMMQNGVFDPATDSVDIAGGMNDWKGEVLKREGTSYIYEITYELPVASVYSYRFRICSSDTVAETADSMSRYIRVDDTTMTVTNYYNNFNPATVAMTFNCNMYYQIKAGHFSPAVDYLDVAGNFNGGGAHDVLFQRSVDSIYALTMFFDTSMIAGPPLSFKFRFNGNWETAELEGDTNRIYPLAATNNSFTCWYNNIDPSVPSLPFVYNVTIHDSLVSKGTVTGAYTYEDYNLKPEGKSIYQWYHADTIGGVLTAIDSAWYINYTIDSLLIGKYLVFEVTPVTFDSVVGLPVQAWSASKIVGVGLNEVKRAIARCYPNPVHSLLVVDFLEPVEDLLIINTLGQTVVTKTVNGTAITILNLENLDPGVYFIRMILKDNSYSVYKILKD
jgi:hypothetical protein